jgi:PAS domain S-box-containing protein
MVHRHFRPLFANSAYAALFGYTAEEILAMDSTLGLYAPDEQARLQVYHAAHLGGEAAPAYYECQGVHKDGRRIWLEMHVRVVDWEGAPATQAAVVDITARKWAEEEVRQACEALEQQVRERTAALAQANAELRAEIAERRRAEAALARRNHELLALYEWVEQDRALKATLLKELNHRVRNNLAAVIGILEVGRERAHLRTADEALDACAAWLKAMANAHDLLAAGAFASMDLRDFIGAVAGGIVRQAGAGTPQIEIVYDEVSLKLPPKPFLALACIINELILNAVKHAFPGCAYGQIEIRAWAEGDRYVLEVRDDGVGFAAEADAVGTGLEIVATLCRTDLRGDYCFLQDGGTIARIAFPKAVAAAGAEP